MPTVMNEASAQELAAHLFTAHFALQGDAAAAGATQNVDARTEYSVKDTHTAQTVEASCYLRTIFGVDGRRPDDARACAEVVLSPSHNESDDVRFGEGRGDINREKCVDPAALVAISHDFARLEHQLLQKHLADDATLVRSSDVLGGSGPTRHIRSMLGDARRALRHLFLLGEHCNNESKAT